METGYFMDNNEIHFNNVSSLAQDTIRKNPFRIYDVEKTEENCLLAVSLNGEALKNIPKVLHTTEICLTAVRQNGFALKHVSKKLLTVEICLAAIQNHASAINYVPDNLRSPAMYTKVIEKNGRFLEYIPTRFINKTRCNIAIKQNGLALKFVPTKFLSKELLSLAINQNGLALACVPSKNKTKNLCLTAVENTPLAIKFVPNRFKTEELCLSALHADWKTFKHLPEIFITLERSIETLERVIRLQNEVFVKDIVSFLPLHIKEDPQIVALTKSNYPQVDTLIVIKNERTFKSKKYDKELGVFRTIERTTNQKKLETKEFSEFLDFYNYIDADLNEVNLFDYNFDGIKLKDFNIDGAYIRSDVLISNNLYDSTFYNNALDINSNFYETMPSLANELAELNSNVPQQEIVDLTLNDSDRRFFYISDMHLNHNLKKKFPEHGSAIEIKLYIRELVKKLLKSVQHKISSDYLLIAGDISFSLQVSEIFYQELSKQWRGKIIVVLGNHELWYKDMPASSFDLFDIIEKYRKMLKDLRIKLLHNELLIVGSHGSKCIAEKKLLNISGEELKSLCLQSSTCILGGVGFSGYNNDFNALNGIYRNTIKTIEEDLLETKKFENVYNKVRSVITDDKVIILTHTPKENWSKDTYNSKWIYVNGHTHQNQCFTDDVKTIYADNQVGYHSSSFGLKHFKLSKIYNIFKYYDSGIYRISREQYLDFNRGIEATVTFNRVSGEIVMLKKSNAYCFIWADKGRLYLLNGGAIKKLTHMDISYYYDNMDVYTNAIKAMLNNYNKALKQISNDIKSIGGLGTVHGCIVDIDFYNHIYVNPIDGKITPYYATSIIDKYTYPNIAKLLKDNRNDLYINYCKALPNNKNSLLSVKNVGLSSQLVHFVPDTSMYEPSRVMKSLQYLTELNVIRNWNDDVITGFIETESLPSNLISSSNNTLL